MWQKDHQALLKAKYCRRVAAASRTQETRVTLTFDLEIQQGTRGCRDTRACKILSS